MPLGLWKSKWEIHREDMDRYREDRARSESEWRDLRQRSDELAEVKLAVRAQTEVIMKLVDRFDEFEGRPPGRAA